MMWHWEDFGMAFNEKNCTIIVPFLLFIVSFFIVFLLKIKPLREMSMVIVKAKANCLRLLLLYLK